MTDERKLMGAHVCISILRVTAQQSYDVPDLLPKIVYHLKNITDPFEMHQLSLYFFKGFKLTYGLKQSV